MPDPPLGGAHSPPPAGAGVVLPGAGRAQQQEETGARRECERAEAERRSRPGHAGAEEQGQQTVKASLPASPLAL